MWVRDFVRSGDPGPDRSMRVERFSQTPLRRAMLPEALGHVVADAIAEHMRRSVCLRDVAPTLAYDGNKLDLIVDERAGLCDHDWIEWAVGRRHSLGEPDLVLGRFHLALSNMVRVVEPN